MQRTFAAYNTETRLFCLLHTHHFNLTNLFIGYFITYRFSTVFNIRYALCTILTVSFLLLCCLQLLFYHLFSLHSQQQSTPSSNNHTSTNYVNNINKEIASVVRYLTVNCYWYRMFIGANFGGLGSSAPRV